MNAMNVCRSPLFHVNIACVYHMPEAGEYSSGTTLPVGICSHAQIALLCYMRQAGEYMYSIDDSFSVGCVLVTVWLGVQFVAKWD